MNQACRLLTLIALLTLLPPAALAAGDDESGLGLNADLGWSSLYVFRGADVFGDDMLLSPGVTWSPREGLSVGWWGAFQLGGEDAEANVDLATGAEQDIYVTYESALGTESLTLASALYLYSYPFAKYDVVGADFPHFLEPGVTLTWSGPIDLGLQIAYMTSFQSALKGYSYLYARPILGFSAEVGGPVTLDAALGFGVKSLGGDYVSSDNRYDAQVDLAGTVATNSPLYLTLGLHSAWSNNQVLGISDELLYWGSLNVGADF